GGCGREQRERGEQCVAKRHPGVLRSLTCRALPDDDPAARRRERIRRSPGAPSARRPFWMRGAARSTIASGPILAPVHPGNVRQASGGSPMTSPRSIAILALALTVPACEPAGQPEAGDIPPAGELVPGQTSDLDVWLV